MPEFRSNICGADDDLVRVFVGRELVTVKGTAEKEGKAVAVDSCIAKSSGASDGRMAVNFDEKVNGKSTAKAALLSGIAELAVEHAFEEVHCKESEVGRKEVLFRLSVRCKVGSEDDGK